MTLLREIQEGATGATVPLTVVLRKCTILATRLAHEPLREWVERELTGYPNIDALPPYRKTGAAQVQGDFAGPFQQVARNLPIAEGSVPEDLRDVCFNVYFLDGVAQLAALVTTSQGMLTSPWPTDLVAALRDRFYENLHAVTVQRIFPAAAVQGVLDAIRNKVLAFALEIEQEAPGAGEASPGEPPLPSERVSQIFHTGIYGGQATIAAAGRDVVQSVEQVNVTERADLVEALRNVGLADDDLAELEQALDADAEASATPGEIGTRTQGWIGRITAKIARGATNVASGTTAELIAGL